MPKQGLIGYVDTCKVQIIAFDESSALERTLDSFSSLKIRRQALAVAHISFRDSSLDACETAEHHIVQFSMCSGLCQFKLVWKNMTTVYHD